MDHSVHSMCYKGWQSLWPTVKCLIQNSQLLRNLDKINNQKDNLTYSQDVVNIFHLKGITIVEMA